MIFFRGRVEINKLFPVFGPNQLNAARSMYLILYMSQKIFCTSFLFGSWIVVLKLFVLKLLIVISTFHKFYFAFHLNLFHLILFFVSPPSAPVLVTPSWRPLSPPYPLVSRPAAPLWGPLVAGSGRSSS